MRELPTLRERCGEARDVRTCADPIDREKMLATVLGLAGLLFMRGWRARR